MTYKSAALAIACLRTIAEQRLSDDYSAITIVVDTSGEDHRTVQDAVSENNWSDWVTVVAAPRNGGFAYGNNLGVARARSLEEIDYIHLLNPDTELRPDAIGALVRFLQSHPAAGIAGSSFENRDGSDWPFAFRFPSALSEFEEGIQLGLVSRLLSRWVVARRMPTRPERVAWVSGASMMIRSSLYELLDGLDEKFFLYFEETDFSFRAAQSGFETWYVPQSRVMHIAGQSTEVTVREAKPQRLPRYWYESRRRFFSKSYGTAYATVADLMAILGRGLGTIKQLLLMRRANVVPNYITDLIKYSWLATGWRRTSQGG